MMSHEQLDTLLRAFTDREHYYREHPGTQSPRLAQIDALNINGEKVFVFDKGQEQELKPRELMICKHIRFSGSPLHIHKYIEINYVYSGCIRQRIGNQSVQLKQGQLCILDTNMPHSADMTGEQDILIDILLPKDYLIVLLMSRMADGMITTFLLNAISNTANHRNYILFDLDKNHRLDFLMREMMCEYFSNDLCAKENVTSYLVLVLSELIRLFSESNYLQINENKNKKIVAEILSYMESNFNTCSLESIAKEFHFHPNYLSKLIKESTGSSYKKLIQMHKLLESCQLLLNTNKPIYEIANTIGYNNLTYYYQIFEGFFGVTPQEYRNNHTFHTIE